MTQVKRENQQVADDQWDGTDIEPGHPRNTEPELVSEGDDTYFRGYSEGDRFA